MILIEQGKIGLDDPVSRFLPEFAKLRVRGPDSTEGPASRPPTAVGDGSPASRNQDEFDNQRA
jgi:CubicO group peptidase (beta-lactamase class C family)